MSFKTEYIYTKGGSDNINKKIWIIGLVFLISGCNKTALKTQTTIEQEENVKIAINYPITHIKKIDNLIDNYINKTYSSFKTEFENKLENQAELNIDYTYNNLTRYISISITAFISTNNLAHPISEVYTINYDKQTNKLIKLGDIIKTEQLKKLIPTIKQDLINKYKECLLIEQLDAKITEQLTDYNLFTINNDNINLLFNPYEISSGNCNILSTSIPFKTEAKKVVNPINIIPEIKDISLDKPTIALTFDDGPSKYTNKILKLLKDNNAVGTFFVIGNKVETYQDTILEMYKNGNEIGNHSYNHKWLTRLTEEEFNEQITKTGDIIKQITGFTPKLLRPTYGSINKKIRSMSPLEITMWTVDTRDWSNTNYQKIAEKALKEIKDGDIVLMHDIYERSYKALEIILSKLKKQGYQFVTVSELNKIKELKEQKK